MNVRKLLHGLVPHKLVALARRVANRKKVDERQKHQRQQRVSCGTLHPDKTFYVIRRPAPGAGLFSNFHWVLGHVIYALDKGYLPVVDMQNYKTFYSEDKPVDGTLNAWEYFFEQPTEYGLDEVYRSRNVILAEMRYLHEVMPETLESSEQVELCRNIASKHLKFNETARSRIAEARRTFFQDRKNILGVLYRGTDYRYARGHAITPSVETSIRKTEECLKEWGMEWIYVMSEEENAIAQFREKFGDKLIVTNSLRIREYDPRMGPVAGIAFARENDKYLRNLEYLIDIALLSECDSLLAANTNGTFVAILLNNNRFMHRYIFHLGNVE